MVNCNLYFTSVLYLSSIVDNRAYTIISNKALNPLKISSD